jgi:hypothetical protein
LNRGHLRSRSINGAAILALALMVVAAPLQAGAASTAGTAAFEAPSSFLTPPMPVVGSGILSTGSFGANSSNGIGLCEGVSSDPGAGPCRLTIWGTYTNVQCGTGIATGTLYLDGSVNVRSGAQYTFVFTGGIGAIVPAGGTTPAVGGVAEVLPNRGDCVRVPIEQFTLSGVVASASS